MRRQRLCRRDVDSIVFFRCRDFKLKNKSDHLRLRRGAEQDEPREKREYCRSEARLHGGGFEDRLEGEGNVFSLQLEKNDEESESSRSAKTVRLSLLKTVFFFSLFCAFPLPSLFFLGGHSRAHLSQTAGADQVEDTGERADREGGIDSLFFFALLPSSLPPPPPPLPLLLLLRRLFLLFCPTASC